MSIMAFFSAGCRETKSMLRNTRRNSRRKRVCSDCRSMFYRDFCELEALSIERRSAGKARERCLQVLLSPR